MAKANLKSHAWKMAKPVPGKDPTLYRQDPYGNTIHRNSYGKSSAMGWDVDHIIPKSRGGADRPLNVQALQSSVNRSKGNSFAKKNRHGAFITPRKK